MLDKELCRRFNVDPFAEWIQNQLDKLEDKLYSGSLEGEDKARVQLLYDAYIEARDTYYQLTKGKTRS